MTKQVGQYEHLRPAHTETIMKRIQLKTDLRLVKIINSEAKPFHICLKNMFSNNFVKLFFKIHNFSLA